MQRVLFFLATIAFSQGLMAQPKAQTPPPAPLSSQIQIPVEKFKLKNGMTVILHEDRSIPSFTYHQWYRVGSANELPGRTGLAHFFEHLMFKGTKNYPKGTMDRLVRANGGDNNAFTTHDYTGYYTKLPSDKLDFIIPIEADRMQNLLFDPKEIQSEREVVKEERRMRVENDVRGALDEAVYNTVFTNHPYHWPVIGYMDDLNAASIDDLKSFYKTYYAPNNAVLVISGNFDVKKAKELIKEHFEKIPAQPVPDLKPAAEPEQKTARSQILKKDVQTITYDMAYPIVESGHPDSFALDLFSTIMTAGASSRLYKKLVYETKLATSVDVESDTSRFAGVMQIIVSLKPGASVEKTMKIIEQELQKVRENGVTPEELAKAKNIVLKIYMDSLKTIGGKARLLAMSEILFGDYNEIFKHLDKYDAVTSKDIQQVTNQYLKPQRRSTVQIVPKK